ncbi:transmembrane protein 65-like [Glandiceps talaboti]
MAASIVRCATSRVFHLHPFQPLYFKNFCPIVCQRRSVFRRRGDRLDNSEKTRDFIAILDQKERILLLDELQCFENELRASKPIGIVIKPPTSKQLRRVALSNAVPFIGFGFLDNAIMIIAGDYIDHSIGVTLGISVMAAAALGNLISDLAGVGLAGYVEAFAAKLGVNPPKLSPEQVDMNSTRYSASFGRAIGITIGCILGMFPLLLLDTSDDKEDKKETEKESDKMKGR